MYFKDCPNQLQVQLLLKTLDSVQDEYQPKRWGCGIKPGRDDLLKMFRENYWEGNEGRLQTKQIHSDFSKLSFRREQDTGTRLASFVQTAE